MKQTAEFFKSLADETRLRLLLLLRRGGELCVCDLMHALDMPQSTVSRHLAYLKKNGWLHDRRGGVWMYYSLAKDLDVVHRSHLDLLSSNQAHSIVSCSDQRRLEAYLKAKDPASCS